MWEKKDADLFNKFLNKISKMEHKECVHSIMWYQGFFQMLKKKKTTFCWQWYKFWEDSGYKLKNITCKIFSLLHKVKKTLYLCLLGKVIHFYRHDDTSVIIEEFFQRWTWK